MKKSEETRVPDTHIWDYAPGDLVGLVFTSGEKEVHRYYEVTKNLSLKEIKYEPEGEEEVTPDIPDEDSNDQ